MAEPALIWFRPSKLQAYAALCTFAASLRMPIVRACGICRFCCVIGIDQFVSRETRGWVWPTSLTPVAFLSWRLAQIDWSGAAPAERARENDRMRLAEQARRREEAAERSSLAASTATRTAIVQRSRALFREPKLYAATGS